MKGKVRCRCYKCQIQQDANRKSETCPNCGKPWKYYVLLWRDGHRIWVGANARGVPLRTYDQADQILSAIRYEITRGIFDLSRYVKKAQKRYLFPEAASAYFDHIEKRSRLTGRPRAYTIYCVKLSFRNHLSFPWSLPP